MKEYQQKRMKEFVMPETVYRQALWVAKDLPRMKKRIEEMTEKINAIYTDGERKQSHGRLQ